MLNTFCLRNIEGIYHKNCSSQAYVCTPMYVRHRNINPEMNHLFCSVDEPIKLLYFIRKKTTFYVYFIFNRAFRRILDFRTTIKYTCNLIFEKQNIIKILMNFVILTLLDAYFTKYGALTLLSSAGTFFRKKASFRDRPKNV